MLPTGHLVAFFVTIMVVIAIPGPSVLFTVGRALTVGRRGAMVTVVGNAVGIYTQAVLVALGLGAILERSAAAYTMLKIAGAAYLVYLGIHAIVHRRRAAALVWSGTAAKSTSRVLGEGFVVGVTNPKMVIFLTAVMPQFVDRDAGHVSGQILALSLVLVSVGLVFDSTWALAAGTARDWFARSPRRIERMSATGGTAMIGLGASFLLLGHDSS